jgi:hypothetical protein
MSDIEKRLRESLAAHARAVPSRDELAERIAGRADGSVVPIAAARSWRTWGLPLIAAGAVAAVAATVVGLNSGRDQHDAVPPPATQVHTGGVTAPPTSAVPTTSAGPVTSAPRNAPDLVDLHIGDLSFVGADRGWVLGTAKCLNGSAAACSAMARTTDGGTSWTSMKPPPANVSSGTGGCADPCVTGIRFATPTIGYAFGPTALFLSTDGGASWHRQAGGAVALETLDGNVIRVSTQCVPGCPYQVQTSPIGSATWQRRASIEAGISPGVILRRAGHSAYLAVLGHTSGGAQAATTALWVSTDDGAGWADRGEPCPQNLPGYGELDTSQVATAADDSVTVLCTPRMQGTAWAFTMTSTDGGRTFTRGYLKALGGGQSAVLAAASANVLLVSLPDGTYRSTDGGQHFARTSNPNGGAAPGPVSWLGFESATLGHALSADGRTLWTTRDAGATWTSLTFG